MSGSARAPSNDLELRKILHGRSRAMLVASAAFSVVAGLGMTAMLAFVSGLAVEPVLSARLLYAFAAVGLTIFVTKVASEALLARLGARVVFDLRLGLVQRLLDAPLPQLERLGAARLMAVLTDDVGVIARGAIVLPVIGSNAIFVCTCIGYLGFLSWRMLVGVIVTMGVGVLLLRLPSSRGATLFAESRRLQDTVFEHFRTITEGAKELKVHRKRREAFVHAVLGPVAGKQRDVATRAALFYQAADGLGTLLAFASVGVVLFAGTRLFGASPRVVTAYALAVFYMLNPIAVVVSFLPVLAQARIAMSRVGQFSDALVRSADAVQVAPLPPSPVETLSLEDVVHEHDEASFTLGPISLELRAGSIVFIVGGNGSGKSTLAKILCGLYPPSQGEYWLNTTQIGDANREWYRQHFSVVLSDYYLFAEIGGFGDVQREARAQKYLEQFELADKVTITNGVLSTRALSHGQRGRLALISALLEDRGIYLFDEWAAHQDARFKRMFYMRILPELKARGKVVIVITHDDQYFHLADDVLKLADGALVNESTAQFMQKVSGGSQR